MASRTNDRWLTLVEVADAEGVAEATIRKRVEKGQFPAPSRFRRKTEPVWSAKALARVADPEPAVEDHLTRDERNEITRAEAVARLLDEVRWWVWQNGDAAIPSRATGRVINGRPYRIGAKVTGTRTAYRRGLLSAAEIAEFEALPGWSWDHVGDSWKARFDDVMTRWPTRLTSDDNAWLSVQRARYESMPQDRQRILASVPGLLTYQGNRRVDQFIEAVSRWLDENPGRTTFSIGYRDEVKVRGEVVKVGRKVTYYRRRYAGMEGRQPLSAEEVARIEALPGWSWELSTPHQRRSRQRAGAA